MRQAVLLGACARVLATRSVTRPGRAAGVAAVGWIGVASSAAEAARPCQGFGPQSPLPQGARSGQPHGFSAGNVFGHAADSR